MVITLYRSEGTVLKLGKHLDTVGEINGHFRGATSLTSPEITIALREYNFNYLSFIFGGRRYYYFLSDHPTIDGDKMILHCDLDRLQTYFDEIIELPFENISIPVPKEYDRVLRIIYSENYMTPVKNSAGHSIKWYYQQEEELLEIFKKCNAEPPAFLFE